MIQSIILILAIFFSITITRDIINAASAHRNPDNADLALIIITSLLWGAFHYLN